MFGVCWWVLLALVADAVDGDIDDDGWVVERACKLPPHTTLPEPSGAELSLSLEEREWRGLACFHHHHHHHRLCQAAAGLFFECHLASFNVYAL
jgi:hypothetical protein